MAEFLLDNYLDQEFQNMMFPLNLMQSVLLQSKYRILHGFVTPNGNASHLLSVLGVLLVIGINTYKLFFYSAHALPESVLVLFVSDSLLYGVSCVIIFLVNIIHSKNNVLLLLKMQHAYNLFTSKDGLKKFQYRNWIYTISVLSISLIFVVLTYCVNPYDSRQTFFVMSLLYFDANTIFATQTIKFLEHEVTMWLLELEKFLAVCSEPNHNELTKYLKEVDWQRERIYKAYKDIMMAFDLCGRIFQYSILLLVFDLFIHPLLYVQTYLFFCLSQYDLGPEGYCQYFNFFYFLSAMVWVVKNFALLVHLSVACQQFYLAVSEVDKTCAIICSQLGDMFITDILKLCKNVSRLNAVRGRLCACGALPVDATLPLRLLALLATYIVVLLQFALL